MRTHQMLTAGRGGFTEGVPVPPPICLRLLGSCCPKSICDVNDARSRNQKRVFEKSSTNMHPRLCTLDCSQLVTSNEAIAKCASSIASLTRSLEGCPIAEDPIAGGTYCCCGAGGAYGAGAGAYATGAGAGAAGGRTGAAGGKAGATGGRAGAAGGRAGAIGGI
jgi:hypothetical protein